MWIRTEYQRTTERSIYLVRHRSGEDPNGNPILTDREVRGLGESRKEAELLSESTGLEVQVLGRDKQGEFLIGLATQEEGAGEAKDPLVRQLYADAVRFGVGVQQELLQKFDPAQIDAFAKMAAALTYFVDAHRKIKPASRNIPYPVLQRTLAGTDDFNLLRFPASGATIAFFMNTAPGLRKYSELRHLGDPKKAGLGDEVPDTITLELDGELHPLRTATVATVQPGTKHPIVLVVEAVGPGWEEKKVAGRIVALYAKEDEARAILFVRRELIKANPFKNRIVFVEFAQLSPRFKIFTKLTGHAWADIVPTPMLKNELDFVKQSIYQADTLKASGISIKRGVLFSSLPGAGKSVSIEAAASELVGHGTVIFFGGGDITKLYEMAQSLGPSVVILEDLDTIVSNRQQTTQYGTSAMSAPMADLLAALSGAGQFNDVITIATTNHPEVIDAAMAKRPGRFDVHVQVPPPDPALKKQILDLYLAKFSIPAPLADEVRTLFDRRLVNLPLVGAHVEEFIRAGVKRGMLKQGAPTIADFEPGAAAVASVAERATSHSIL